MNSALGNQVHVLFALIQFALRWYLIQLVFLFAMSKAASRSSSHHWRCSWEMRAQ